MNCSAILDQILDADLDVLDGSADSDVARHLRACARCQKVARQILSDTRSLAVAVADVRATIELVPAAAAPALVRPRRRSSVRIAVAAGLAATLCVVVAREWTRLKAVPRDGSQLVAVNTRMANAPTLAMPPATALASRPPELRRVRPARRRRAAGEATQAEQPSDRGTPQVLATVAARTIVDPIRPPSAVVPVRIDTTTSVALGSAVAVDPPAGVRANIIRTPNPAVTVVWLYQ